LKSITTSHGGVHTPCNLHISKTAVLLLASNDLSKEPFKA